jgi:hypothetical protein
LMRPLISAADVDEGGCTAGAGAPSLINAFILSNGV